jgi:hypothetical protein
VVGSFFIAVVAVMGGLASLSTSWAPRFSSTCSDLVSPMASMPGLRP